jgi:hypothetical protein
MTTSILIETISQNKDLKNLSIPSCLFVSPYQYPSNIFKLKEKEDDIIDDKLFDYLISAVENSSNKKYSRKSKKSSKQKTKKKK